MRLWFQFLIMIKKFNSIFVTMFSLGRIGFLSGTFGSLATVIFLFVCFHILNISSNIILIILVITFAYSFIAIKNYTENNENKDPGEIIIDEFIGQAIPIYLYEISHGTEKTMDQAPIIYTVCFIIFRIFDILKPFPVSYFDRKHKNSFGVVMDDVCAGLYVVLSLICFMILKSLI